MKEATFLDFQTERGAVKVLLRHSLAGFFAYYFVLYFIYPGWIMLPAAHHADMYGGADLAARHVGIDLLRWPRPVLMMTWAMVSELPFELSLLLLGFIWILNFSLLLSLLEIVYLKTRISFWIGVLSLIIAMGAPGFYISYTYDMGSSLSAFFGLMAIWTWELAPSGARNLVIGLVFCILSALSKESFIPVLGIYALATAFCRYQKGIPWIPLAVAPFIAAAISLANSILMESPFVRVHPTHEDPYYVSFRISSLMHSAAYYTEPELHISCALAGCFCLLAAWVQKRLVLSVLIMLASASLFAPYLILPNHLMAYYWWTPFPILMLLVPTALVTRDDCVEDRKTIFGRSLRFAVFVSLVLSCYLCVRDFRAFNRQNLVWCLEQENLNRNLVSGLRSLKPELRGASSVLVSGLTGPFHPWIHPKFLAREFDYEGVWSLLRESGSPPVAYPSGDVTSVTANEIRWESFDLVIVFDDQNRLRAFPSRKEIARLMANFSLSGEDMAIIVRHPDLASLMDVITFNNADFRQLFLIGKELEKFSRHKIASQLLAASAERGGSEDPYVHFYLAKALENLGETGDAILHYRKAVQLDPASAQNKNPLFISELQRLDSIR